MMRNIILSIIIGTLATYLPFWQWEGAAEQALGAVVIGIITLSVLTVLEKAPGVATH